MIYSHFFKNTLFMENHFLIQEKKEIENKDFIPKRRFTLKYELLKKLKIKKVKKNYKEMSTFDLLKLKKYNSKIGNILKKRSIYEIIAYFQSIPILKDKLFYWNPFKKVNDPLSLIIEYFDEKKLLEKIKMAKCNSLIFHKKGFPNFEKMLSERINILDLKVLDKDFEFFSKHWTIKKGKLSLFFEYIQNLNIPIKHSRKTIEVCQRIITHPFWCEENCHSSFSFIKFPSSKNLEFSPISCFSFVEIEIKNKIFMVNFKQFKGLLEKDKNYEEFWKKLGVDYCENIEFH